MVSYLDDCYIWAVIIAGAAAATVFLSAQLHLVSAIQGGAAQLLVTSDLLFSCPRQDFHSRRYASASLLEGNAVARNEDDVQHLHLLGPAASPPFIVFTATMERA
ncbi:MULTISPECIES: hypothetical protein [unclassified Bradyrhizobium]|uniref:hypothetical protein n=1 Tax=unclassified Bradyrhizobium TaxID=2631580 RepID=UPI002FF41C6F